LVLCKGATTTEAEANKVVLSIEEIAQLLTEAEDTKELIGQGANLKEEGVKVIKSPRTQ